MSFANRAVIVTGASGGIGWALAQQLAAQGARVGAIARRAEQLAELEQSVRMTGGTIATAVGDVGDREAIHAAVRSLTEKLGPIDVMIANAGVGVPSGADPMQVHNVETMMRVNFLGVVYSLETVLPEMLRRRSGHLVAISSMAAYKGLPGSAGYCASKAAVSSYCEGLRIELRSRGVAVTTVCPGFIDTPMTAKNDRAMPFLMSADRAARRILRALERRPAVYDFPKRMRFLMWLAKWAPDRTIARQIPAGAIPRE
ncbi:MAG: SDR family NAD(P)-dependent oxidoreductase [Bacteroidales bacterium]|nr:SDR family NAD(P)-dependent oxidoreductase [Bacteroidales bacterium]